MPVKTKGGVDAGSLVLVLVGLGNPGEKYAKHRHNVGFMAVDAIADAHGFGPTRSKFQGEVREGFLDGPGGRAKSMILKPMTFMNESGRSIQEIARFYKLNPEDFAVFYDELDLAAGKLKIKTGGGHAGHNGIRSIDAHLGNNFQRVRIGIGHPGDKSKVTSHVLGNFSKTDQDWLVPLLSAMAAAAPKLADDSAKFLSDVALRLRPNENEEPELKQGRGAINRNEKTTKPEANIEQSEEKKRGPLAEALQKLLGRDNRGRDNRGRDNRGRDNRGQNNQKQKD